MVMGEGERGNGASPIWPWKKRGRGGKGAFIRKEAIPEGEKRGKNRCDIVGEGTDRRKSQERAVETCGAGAEEC